MLTELSIVLSLSAILFGIYALFIIKRYRNFDETKDKAQINSIRDIIEKKIYRQESILMNDPNHFFDSTKLLVKFAPESDFDNRIPNDSFFINLGINFNEILTKQNTAFCLMPFNENFKSSYLQIKKSCQEAGVICSRSDEVYYPGNLLQQIIKSIAESQYIFAVLDGRNPNVFYELGLCHAIGKPVYLIAHYNSKDTIPFDISSSRLILYKSGKDLASKLQEILTPNQEK